METDPILVSRSDGVCELRLNRPEKRNAITLAMYETLWQELVRAEADESVRVILLTGAGPGFTAGNDLQDFVSHPQTDDMRIGVTMLLHCDLVVAARSTRLSLPFVKLGLVPEAGSSLLLPRLIGYPRAAEMLLLGTPIDAPTALSYGLVNRVVEDDALLSEARALALAVAEQPAGALRAAKQLMRSETGVTARIEEELVAFRERLGSAEFKAAAQAFFNKGK
jgi:enoyl-CoA hydratase/carnithine racemase